ncbi:MAG: Rieske 2Fe-2S domain-containing protein [Acidobacteria bacterium]|nr:Rieske 2Fe-2S domain-containing protein [Acidobacteriota bacterium]
MARVVLVGQNSDLRKRLEEVAHTAGLDLISFPGVEALAVSEPPAVLVVELELKGAIDGVANCKRRWPACMVIGAMRLPIQELWHAAVAAGADLVSNWGALPRQLQHRLEAYQRGESLVPKAVRIKVMLYDRQGDGLVGRLPDAQGGPVAVFRIDQKLCAIRDVCPHEGASLADGQVDGKVLTCPRHGSQFHVCTGSRLRGPADYSIRTYRVVIEDGETFVEL